MEQIEIVKQKLRDQGFLHIFEWHDPSGEMYEPHAHTGRVMIYILGGGLTMRFGEKKLVLKEGDLLDVPIGEEHSAKVGLDGCHFLVGEMIEGDS